MYSVIHSHAANLRREIEKNSELQQQLKYIVDEEKNVRDELKGTRKEFEDYKKKAEEKIHGLQRQMLKLNSEVEEVLCSARMPCQHIFYHNLSPFSLL